MSHTVPLLQVVGGIENRHAGISILKNGPTTIVRTQKDFVETKTSEPSL
jgi:hypothetical protein